MKQLFVYFLFLDAISFVTLRHCMQKSTENCFISCYALPLAASYSYSCAIFATKFHNSKNHLKKKREILLAHSTDIYTPHQPTQKQISTLTYSCSYPIFSLNLAFAGAKASTEECMATNGQQTNKGMAADGQQTNKKMAADGQQTNKDLLQCTQEGCLRFFTLRNFRQHKSKCQKMKPRMRRLETEVSE